MVHNVKFPSKDGFLKAGEFLMKRRGAFNMLPGDVLSVTEDQYQALDAAGLLSSVNGAKGRKSGPKGKQKKS